jgi:hypothetical protein
MNVDLRHHSHDRVLHRGELHEAASVAGMSAIVTRDREGFANATLPVFDPHELLAAVAAAASEQ